MSQVQRYSNRAGDSSSQTISDEQLRNIIVGGDAVVLVNVADKFGQSIKGISKSQIRNIFGEVRRIQLDWSQTEEKPEENFRRILLLRPRMAYQAGRKPETKPLMDVLGNAVKLISEASDNDAKFTRFQRFVEFFEAILAYHTAAGGKQGQ